MALAIALPRAGIATEIVEIDKDWRVYGAGITITGPTLRALDRLGLLDAVVNEGYCYDATRICDASGNVILASRVSGRPMGPRIPNGGGILRPVLHRILATATRASGAAVRLGVSVATLEQTGDAVSVGFTDGTHGAYDLVVGADGIHSRLRGMLFPDAPKPKLTGQGCWRALVPRPAEIDCAQVYVGGPVKGRSHAGVAREEMYLFLLQHVPDNPRMPEERWPELLAEQLRGFDGSLGAVRDGLTASSQINYRPLEKLLVPPPWHRGRIILIGDAAHATTPHLASGAGLAVEDALVLGECLASGNRAGGRIAALHGAALRAMPHGCGKFRAARRIGNEPRAGGGAGGAAARVDEGLGRADLITASAVRRSRHGRNAGTGRPALPM